MERGMNGSMVQLKGKWREAREGKGKPDEKTGRQGAAAVAVIRWSAGPLGIGPARQARHSVGTAKCGEGKRATSIHPSVGRVGSAGVSRALPLPAWLSLSLSLIPKPKKLRQSQTNWFVELVWVCLGLVTGTAARFRHIFRFCCFGSGTDRAVSYGLYAPFFSIPN